MIGRVPTGSSLSDTSGGIGEANVNDLPHLTRDQIVSRLRPGERILDVGCGCGATTIALAERVAPSGSAFGIDISVPMLSRARQLAPHGLPLDFVLADATVYPFDPASFDLLASRFG